MFPAPALFRNRKHAGERLAAHLVPLINEKDVVVVGVPRGGVPVAAEVARELNAPLELYPPENILTDRTVILVDDGLAPSIILQAALHSIYEQRPKKLILALPVGASTACVGFKKECDEVICLYDPQNLFGVSEWYEDFEQTSDEVVLNLLEENLNRRDNLEARKHRRLAQA